MSMISDTYVQCHLFAARQQVYIIDRMLKRKILKKSSIRLSIYLHHQKNYLARKHSTSLVKLFSKIPFMKEADRSSSTPV